MHGTFVPKNFTVTHFKTKSHNINYVSSLHITSLIYACLPFCLLMCKGRTVITKYLLFVSHVENNDYPSVITI